MLSAMSRLIYLPCPIEAIKVLSIYLEKRSYLCRSAQGGQGKSSQVTSPVAVAGSLANKCRECKWSIKAYLHFGINHVKLGFFEKITDFFAFFEHTNLVQFLL